MRVLAVLIDALRCDSLSEESTPFLHRMSREGFSAPLRPILGYSDSIRATIYTGAYPDQHNYWMAYRYSPGDSPFGGYARFAFVDRLPAPVRPWAKLALSKVAGQGTIHNLPTRVAPFFDYTARTNPLDEGAFGSTRTLFDVLRGNGRRFAHVGSDRLGMRRFWFARSAFGKLPEAIGRLGPETQLVFLFIHYLDNAAHRYGLRSRLYRRELRDVDRLVERCVLRARETPGATEVMVFSDHGMADARRYVTFDELARLDGFGDDFVFVTDSTMVRVWYLNDRSKEQVRSVIESSRCGRFLSADDRHKLHLEFSHRYYGDDIYLIEPPFSIFPNSTSLLKPRAMHAYHPDLDSQQGIFLGMGERLGGVTAHGRPVDLTEIMPTALKLLGLEAPSTCRGEPLV